MQLKIKWGFHRGRFILKISTEVAAGALCCSMRWTRNGPSLLQALPPLWKARPPRHRGSPLRWPLVKESICPPPRAGRLMTG